jgi:hypothetical protein
MGMMTNAYKVIIRKHEEKELLGRPGGDGREDYAKLILKK